MGDGGAVTGAGADAAGGRVTASAAVAYKNQIYVFGGFDGWDVSDLVQIYDPKVHDRGTRGGGQGCGGGQGAWLRGVGQGCEAWLRGVVAAAE